MRFISTLPLLIVAVQSKVSPSDLINTLNQFKQTALALQGSAKQVTQVNGVGVIAHTGPLWGLNNAADTGAQVAAQLPGTSPIGPGPDADNVSTAYAGFAKAHVDLFNILTSKSGYWNFDVTGTKGKIGQPVYNALERVKPIIDGVSDFVNSTVSSKSAAIVSQWTPLDSALDSCISGYARTCGSSCS